MKSFFRRSYISFCRRIYNVGKKEAERIHSDRQKEVAIVGEGTILYPCSAILNLANIRDRITIGSNSHIYGNLTVYSYAGEISIGNYCSLGDNSRIVSGKAIRIGNRVMIAHNVNILDNNSHPIDAALRHEDFKSNYGSGMKQYDLHAEEINIQDDVWIGFNSIILKGVTIGKGAIIGAGSVVTKNVEAWTVNVGNPARCVYKLEAVNF